MRFLVMCSCDIIHRQVFIKVTLGVAATGFENPVSNQEGNMAHVRKYVACFFTPSTDSARLAKKKKTKHVAQCKR
jgi:hypothetical protein